MLRGEVPAEGLVILRESQPGEKEPALSPLAYHYQHRAEIEAAVQGTNCDTAFRYLLSHYRHGTRPRPHGWAGSATVSRPRLRGPWTCL